MTKPKKLCSFTWCTPILTISPESEVISHFLWPNRKTEGQDFRTPFGKIKITSGCEEIFPIRKHHVKADDFLYFFMSSKNFFTQFLIRFEQHFQSGEVFLSPYGTNTHSQRQKRESGSCKSTPVEREKVSQFVAYITGSPLLLVFGR